VTVDDQEAHSVDIHLLYALELDAASMSSAEQKSKWDISAPSPACGAVGSLASPTSSEQDAVTGLALLANGAALEAVVSPPSPAASTTPSENANLADIAEAMALSVLRSAVSPTAVPLTIFAASQVPEIPVDPVCS
jgi:hypothetical protein